MSGGRDRQSGSERPSSDGSRLPDPPRFPRWLLRRALGARAASEAEGELAEAFTERFERDGAASARRWYRRQVAGFVLRAPVIWKLMREEAERIPWLPAILRDARWTLRGFRRRPTFAFVAAATLALGIAANSAIFTLVNAHFFADLPYQRPSELVLVWETSRNSLDVTTVAPGNYFAWRDQAASFTDVAAFNVSDATVSGGGSAEEVRASVVTPHFFEVLGVRPALGDGFSEPVVRDANGSVVVLAHGLWTRRYGADPEIVGKDIRVDGAPYTVVGVMPADFRQPEQSLTWQEPELWRPLDLGAQRGDFGSRYLRTIARLRPGVDVIAARAEMDRVAERMALEQPEGNTGRAILVYTLEEYLMGDARPTLLMLLAAGAAVFLLVCANVANLALTRGEERRQEFAVRAALGSGRTRLLRQLVVEGVVLALVGAALGALLIYGVRDALQSVQASFFTSLVAADVNAGVVAFTAAAALLAGLLLALPLVHSVAGSAMHGAMVESSPRAGGRRRAGRARALLIVGQVALATSLAVLATLLTRSFNELVRVDPGFRPDNVLTFSVTAPNGDRENVLAYFRELRAELERIPGVGEIGMVSDMPFTTENRFTRLVMPGRVADPIDPPEAEYHVTSPQYFEVMGIPLRAGRLPSDEWERLNPAPVIVNEEMADAFWPGQDALGETFSLERAGGMTPLTIVGVVGNVLDDGFAAEPEASFYVPFGSVVQRPMAFVLEVTGDAGEVTAGVRQAVERVNQDVPAANLRMVDTMMAETVARPRAASLLGASFALLALLVAAAGIYGVVGYAVQTRTREIGIRTALGASGPQLVKMVMGQSTRLITVGLGVGCVAAILAGRVMSGLLFGVRWWDPASLLAAPALLGAVAAVAAWLPARRAVRIDPKEALRTE
jgi:predicted permease